MRCTTARTSRNPSSARNAKDANGKHSYHSFHGCHSRHCHIPNPKTWCHWENMQFRIGNVLEDLGANSCHSKKNLFAMLAILNSIACHLDCKIAILPSPRMYETGDLLVHCPGSSAWGNTLQLQPPINFMSLCMPRAFYLGLFGINIFFANSGVLFKMGTPKTQTRSSHLETS